MMRSIVAWLLLASMGAVVPVGATERLAFSRTYYESGNTCVYGETLLQSDVAALALKGYRAEVSFERRCPTIRYYHDRPHQADAIQYLPHVRTRECLDPVVGTSLGADLVTRFQGSTVGGGGYPIVNGGQQGACPFVIFLRYYSPQ